MILCNEKLINSAKEWFEPNGLTQFKKEILQTEKEAFEQLNRLETFDGAGNSSLKLPMYVHIIAAKGLKKDYQQASIYVDLFRKVIDANAKMYLMEDEEQL